MVILLFSFLVISQKTPFDSFQNMSKEEVKISIVKRNLKIDSMPKLKYINRKYKYLDEEFKTTIPKDTFILAIKKYGFHKDAIRKYKDSLSLVLMHELKD